MAVNWDILKDRYLETSEAAQIDSLMLNLVRLQALADSGADELVARHLVRESQFFIEWTVPSLNLETDLTFATELIDLQRLLSRWKLKWPELWGSDQERKGIAAIAQSWCGKLQAQLQKHKVNSK